MDQIVRVCGLAARWVRVLAAGGLVALATGCASHYVDTGLKDVALRKPTNPKPVQLVFEFQSKGVANARATELLKAQVTDVTTKSGLFSSVSAEPVPGGALLSVTLNNVPVGDDGVSKGFVTGLTFGAVGNVVTDGYVCSATYRPGGGGPKTSVEVRHAIHTVLGAKGAPPDAVAAASLDEAVTTMTRQAVLNALDRLSIDSQFN